MDHLIEHLWNHRFSVAGSGGKTITCRQAFDSNLEYADPRLFHPRCILGDNSILIPTLKSCVNPHPSGIEPWLGFACYPLECTGILRLRTNHRPFATRFGTYLVRHSFTGAVHVDHLTEHLWNHRFPFASSGRKTIICQRAFDSDLEYANPRLFHSNDLVGDRIVLLPTRGRFSNICHS